jgi:predicted small secreted protein
MKNTKFFFICLSLAATGLLSACNTIKGVGQDVQRAGSAIENSMKK